MKKISLLSLTMAALLLLSGVFVSCSEDSVDGVGVSQFSSFEVSPASITLSCGESQQITVTTEPEYTFAEGELTYTITTASPEDCITVSDSGVVTAIDELYGTSGSATIIVNTTDGANARYVSVKVNESKSITIDSDDLLISTVSEIQQLYAIVGGFSGEDFYVEWKSTETQALDIKAYATNSQYGEIAMGTGGKTTVTATIYAGAAEYNDDGDIIYNDAEKTEYSDSIEIEVLSVTVSVDGGEALTLNYGDEAHQFSATVKLDGVATDTMAIEWYLSDAAGNELVESKDADDDTDPTLINTTDSSITTDGLFTAGDIPGDVYVSARVSGFSGIAPFGTSKKITVYVPLSVKINETDPTVYTYTKSYSYTFSTTLSPTTANLYDERDVVWSLEGDNITGNVKVEDGVVSLETGSESYTGVVTVTATIYKDAGNTGDVESSNSTTLTFTNEAVAVVTGIEITNGESITDKTIGNTILLSATITPADAANQLMHWEIVSGKDSVITLDGSTVTIIGTGTAEVKVTPDDKFTGGLSDTITIQVLGFSVPDLEDGGEL